ncbi:MAG TPA: hypothetical protein VND19_11260, partial [Acetobacteraceae bacterium]|nr:hypothetical protein [Acetobacteraceae bacterium]
MARWPGGYTTGSDSNRRSFASEKIGIRMAGRRNFYCNRHFSVTDTIAVPCEVIPLTGARRRQPPLVHDINRPSNRLAMRSFS